MPWGPQIESTNRQTSQLSRHSLLEELRLHSRDADAHSTRPHENVKSFCRIQIQIYQNRVTEHKWFQMDQTSIQHPNTWDNAQVLAFFPPDHPVCQFWRPAWQSYTPWPWTAIHVQKPCSWRQVSETKDACLVIGYLRGYEVYLLPRGMLEAGSK